VSGAPSGPVLCVPLPSLEADIAALEARIATLEEELKAQLAALEKLAAKHAQATRFGPLLRELGKCGHRGLYCPGHRLQDIAKALGWGYAKTSAIVLEALSLGLIDRVDRGKYRLPG
jgi:hypothetical protein